MKIVKANIGDIVYPYVVNLTLLTSHDIIKQVIHIATMSAADQLYYWDLTSVRQAPDMSNYFNYFEAMYSEEDGDEVPSDTVIQIGSSLFNGLFYFFTRLAFYVEDDALEDIEIDANFNVSLYYQNDNEDIDSTINV